MEKSELQKSKGKRSETYSQISDFGMSRNAF